MAEKLGQRPEVGANVDRMERLPKRSGDAGTLLLGRRRRGGRAPRSVPLGGGRRVDGALGPIAAARIGAFGSLCTGQR